MSTPIRRGRLLRPIHTQVQFPEQEEVAPQIEAVAAFLKYCRKLKPDGDFAPRDDFNAELLRPWIGHIMILDYIPDVRDFRYRVYGTDIANHAGFDVTGRLVSEFQSDTGEFFLKLYRECVDKRVLIFSINSGTHSRFDCDWHRIICPVRRADAVQIVACNYPTKRVVDD